MKLIDPSTLRPADVLLSLGEGDISAAIQTLDGGQYSHAALWSGTGVIESTTPKVVERSLEDSLAAHPRVHVDVYRHARAGAARARIVAAARRYLGRRYGYGDLALVSLLVATSKWLPGERSQVAFLIRAGQLHKFLRLDAEAKDELVTCVELVIRAYLHAGVALAITIEAAGRFDARLIGAGILELGHDAKRSPIGDVEALRAWAELQRATADKYRELLGSDPRWPSLGAEDSDPLRGCAARVVNVGADWAPNLVTPRQLETSPDLRWIGRLRQADSPARRRPA